MTVFSFVRQKSFSSAIFFGLFLLLSGCVPTDSGSDALVEDVSEPAISSTALTVALLTDDEIQAVQGLEDAHPATIELSDRLETDRQDSYLYSVARAWYDPLRADAWVANAITLYGSGEEAIVGTDLLAGDVETLSGASPVGDYSVAYYSDPEEGDDAFESNLPNVTYRFVVGPCSVKVRVFAQGDLVALPVDSMKSELERMAYALANAQVERLESVLNDQWFAAANLTDATTLLPNAAILHLPESFSGTTLIGTSFFTQREWRGMEGNFDKDIPGFQSGALRRFEIDARPGEVVEVAVFEFDTAAAAQVFQSELVNGDGVTVLTLGTDLDPVGDAISINGIYELQMVQGHYMVDVSVMSPFGEIDPQAAEVDMQAFALEVIEQW
jgi:hypothetical protein